MPFTFHIIHAIGINLVRMGAYGYRSLGRSFIVSVGLIGFEVSIVPLAIFYDCWARLRFKTIAPQIMEDDFISMNETPSFQSLDSQIPGSSRFEFLNVKSWRVEVSEHLKKDEWHEAYLLLENIRQDLENNGSGSHYLCKHFLESVHLAIGNSINWSRGMDNESKRRFMAHRRLFIWWQAVGYEGAQLLDYFAFPLHQNLSLPILIRDVPKIPVPNIQE